MELNEGLCYDSPVARIALFLISFLAGVFSRSFFNIPSEWVYLGIGLTGGILLFSFILERAKSQPSISPGNLTNCPQLSECEARLPAGRQVGAPRAGEGGLRPSETEVAGNEFSGKFFLKKMSLVVFLFFLGILRFDLYENNIQDDFLHLHYGEEMVLDGAVLKSIPKPNSEQLIVETGLGKLRVVKAVYPQYKYGDTLKISGKIEEPEVFGAIDNKKLLAKDLVYSEMIFPEIEKKENLASENSTARFSSLKIKFFSFLFMVKDGFEKKLRLILPEPHASLADGMLLGNQGFLEKGLVDNFRKSGTIHILVLSGYNITIVGIFTMALFGMIFPESVAWLLAVAAISAFTLMSGAEAAAVRSALMAVIGLLAFRAGRKNTALLALMWAAMFMVLWNPLLMRFDRGFQLSFLATLGLIIASSFFQKIFSFIPKTLGLRENAAASFAAQIFVLPLLLSWGGEISWLSPLANILIASVVPLVMLFGFLGGIFSFFSLGLGKIIAGAAYILIAYQIYLVNFFGGLSFSMIKFGFLPISLLLFIYAALFYWSWIRFRSSNRLQT
ncbi:ComEC/Rec2 family competence protein [Candidatus Giovannonibacteria bacterium]|nr:ComEC/Rec2 family competence protein [Candidatus Giovannonibacteria bacterium]